MDAPDKDYTAAVMQTMYQFSKERIMTDFRVKAGGRTANCHQAVIATKSGYFRSLSQSGLKEAILDSSVSTDEHGNILDSVIQFLYLGNCNITSHNVASLLLAADFIQLKELKEKCEQFLSSNLKMDQLASFYQLAKKFQLQALCDECMLLAKKNFTEVDLMHGLHGEGPARSSYSDARRARQGAGACATPPPSKPAAPASTPAKSPSQPASKSFSPSSGAVPKTPKPSAAARPADILESILILGGLLPGETNHPRILFLEKDADVADLPAPPILATIETQTPSLCMNDEFLIVSGGYDITTKRSVATVQIFDIRRKRWSNLPDLPHPVQFHGSAITNGNMYNLGGCYMENGEIKHRYNTIHRIELPAGKWIECDARLPSAVASPGIATVEDDIVIVGGGTDSGFTAQTSRFNTKNHNLTYCQPMLKPDVVYRSMVSVAHHIYVLSGTQFLCFDLHNDSWSSLAMPMKPSYASAMVLKQHRLIAMGGFDDYLKNPNDRVQVYDLKTRKWEAQKNMPLKLVGHWAFVMKQSS